MRLHHLRHVHPRDGLRAAANLLRQHLLGGRVDVSKVSVRAFSILAGWNTYSRRFAGLSLTLPQLRHLLLFKVNRIKMSDGPECMETLPENQFLETKLREHWQSI